MKKYELTLSTLNFDTRSNDDLLADVDKAKRLLTPHLNEKTRMLVKESFLTIYLDYGHASETQEQKNNNLLTQVLSFVPNRLISVVIDNSKTEEFITGRMEQRILNDVSFCRSEIKNMSTHPKVGMLNMNYDLYLENVKSQPSRKSKPSEFFVNYIATLLKNLEFNKTLGKNILPFLIKKEEPNLENYQSLYNIKITQGIYTYIDLLGQKRFTKPFAESPGTNYDNDQYWYKNFNISSLKNANLEVERYINISGVIMRYSNLTRQYLTAQKMYNESQNQNIQKTQDDVLKIITRFKKGMDALKSAIIDNVDIQKLNFKLYFENVDTRTIDFYLHLKNSIESNKDKPCYDSKTSFDNTILSQAASMIQGENDQDNHEYFFDMWDSPDLQYVALSTNELFNQHKMKYPDIIDDAQRELLSKLSKFTDTTEKNDIAQKEFTNEEKEKEIFTIEQTKKIISHHIPLLYQGCMGYHNGIFVDSESTESEQINTPRRFSVHDYVNKRAKYMYHVIKNTQKSDAIMFVKEIIDNVREHLNILHHYLADYTSNNSISNSDIDYNVRMCLLLTRKVFEYLISLHFSKICIHHSYEEEFNALKDINRVVLKFMNTLYPNTSYKSTISNLSTDNFDFKIKDQDVAECLMAFSLFKLNQIHILEDKNIASYVPLSSDGRIVFMSNREIALLNRLIGSHQQNKISCSKVFQDVLYTKATTLDFFMVSVNQILINAMIQSRDNNLRIEDWTFVFALQYESAELQKLHFQNALKILEDNDTKLSYFSINYGAHKPIFTKAIKKLSEVSEYLISDDWVKMCKDYTNSMFLKHIYDGIMQNYCDIQNYCINIPYKLLIESYIKGLASADECKNYMLKNCEKINSQLQLSLKDIKIRNIENNDGMTENLAIKEDIKLLVQQFEDFKKIIKYIQNEEIQKLFNQYNQCKENVGSAHLQECKKYISENPATDKTIVKLYSLITSFLKEKSVSINTLYKRSDLLCTQIYNTKTNIVQKVHKSYKNNLVNIFDSNKFDSDFKEFQQILDTSYNDFVNVTFIIKVYNQAVSDRIKSMNNIAEKLFKLIVDDTDQQLADIVDEVAKLSDESVQNLYDKHVKTRNKILEKINKYFICKNKLNTGKVNLDSSAKNIEGLSKGLKKLTDHKNVINKKILESQELKTNKVEDLATLLKYVQNIYDLSSLCNEVIENNEKCILFSGKIQNALNILESKTNELAFQKFVGIKEKFIRCYDGILSNYKNILYLTRINDKILNNETMSKYLEETQNSHTLKKDMRINTNNLDLLRKMEYKAKISYQNLFEQVFNSSNKNNIKLSDFDINTLKEMSDREFARLILRYTEQKDTSIEELNIELSKVFYAINLISKYEANHHYMQVEFCGYILTKFILAVISNTEQNVGVLQNNINDIDKMYKAKNSLDDIDQIKQCIQSSMNSYKKHYNKLEHLNNKFKISDISHDSIDDEKAIKRYCKNVNMKDLNSVIDQIIIFTDEEKKLHNLYETYKQKIHDYIDDQENQDNQMFDNQDQNVNDTDEHENTNDVNIAHNIISQDNLEYNTIPHIGDIETDHNSNVMGSEYNVHHNE